MKNTIVEGLILSIAQISSKILSLFFIFYLASKAKSLGLYLYSYAYIPFSLFLDLSAFGIIPGISKSVALLNSEYKNQNTHYLLKSGTVFSIILGISFYFIVNIFKSFILKATLYDGYTYLEYDIILNNLSIASLSILIFPLLSFYKGYMQGHMRMLPSALSILLEAFTRLSLLLLLGNNTNPLYFEKVFIINFVSYLVGLLVMLIFVFKDYFNKGRCFHSIIYILKRMIPFGMATLFFTIYQLIDSITLNQQSSYIYTSYMFEATRLIYLPIVACKAIGAVLTPKINYLYKNKDDDSTNSLARAITNNSIIFLVIVFYLFFHNGEYIYNLFYGNGAFSILRNSSILILFIGLYIVMIGLSQGMPKFEYIIIVAIISSISKYALNILMIPYYGYIGSIIGTISALSICILFSYYLLYKGGIRIFMENVKAMLISIISLAVSIYFSILINFFFINKIPFINKEILFSGFIFLFYILIISFVRLIRVSKNKYLHINK